ncbi:xanthine dehydrogenase family protein subunit M [Phaeobacter sp. 22II1-1F12B]|uniref:FAD binding domain-containing protein n=1 Tax=Phaeobacter sp. 22II1-1F12B TaxID=1317111 RepID=UPI000B524FA4|nr:xanthine dehydrogenase family protein subunit M [Phaeobacter sp. 22II1-1F12B]OWU73836.1 molybdopterin dehydrogenase [Phaeobacter sp. 22II1-1F12B]
MNRFDYIRPGSVAEAVAAASEAGAAYLAGGTNLLDLMKIGVVAPGKVIDITRLPGLDRIDWLEDGSVRIGAMVRNADLARNPAFSAAFPAVSEALLSGASPQLRNAATVGGNLMQETRCAYFQDPLSHCNRRAPGAGCDALEGHNRSHAVLGWTPSCIATHPSDFCVPLAALGAVVEIEGPDGSREVDLASLHELPGTDSAGGIALKHGEMITALRLPAEASAFAGHSRYLKLRERTSFAFALVSAAAMLRMEQETIAEARIALGAVAARPWRAAEAETFLKGKKAEPDAFAEAAQIALKEASPSGDNAFKITLATRVLTRALTLAAKGTPDRVPALPASVFTSSEGATAHA